jgi:hypothetical protein
MSLCLMKRDFNISTPTPLRPQIIILDSHIPTPLSSASHPFLVPRVNGPRLPFSALLSLAAIRLLQKSSPGSRELGRIV